MTATPTEAPPSSAGVLRTLKDTPVAVRAVLAGVFVQRLAGFIKVFLVLFMTDRGYTAGQAGLALGCYSAGSVLGVLAGGLLADRLGPRLSTIVAMTGGAAFIVALLYAPTFPVLLAVVTGVSAIGHLSRPASQALLAELTPPDRLVMVTAMFRMSLNLGTTVAPLLGAALLSLSYGWLFWGEAAAALVYAAVAAIALPKRRATTAASRKLDETPNADPGYRALLADRRFLFFVAAVFLDAVVYSQFLVVMPLDLTAAGVSLWWFSVVVSLNGFLVITCELAATRFVRHWPLTRTVVLGFGLPAAGYAIFALPPLPALLIAGTIVWTLSEIIGSPTISAFPGMTAPEHLRGRYIGAAQAAFGIGGAIGPVIGAAMWAGVGHPVWLAFAAISLAAVAAGRLGVRTDRPERAGM